MASPSGRTLRKRKSLDKDQRRLDDLAEFFQIAAEAKSVLVFSGSGMSASAGLSTFTSPGGLYERAKKRFKVKDGIMLFCDSFYRKRGKDVRKVMGEIFFEATSSCPTLAHEALGRLEASGRLLRHYTMNVDGLHRLVDGMTTWSGRRDCPGKTVELHGCCREIVCTNESCPKQASDMTVEQGKAFRRGLDVLCEGCKGAVRPKIMLYDDSQSELITPDVVMEVMDADILEADLILWVGISFQQSASLEYFRNVSRVIKECGREGDVAQAIVNPCEESHFNAISGAGALLDDLKIIQVVSNANSVLADL
mmetsp:Transcript_1041/g.3727  ORF Transcript_1041/g.3727 Transcript_1041/m.3727 type:complete len:309 (-) Transcript_1041:70-996(-)